MAPGMAIVLKTVLLSVGEQNLACIAVISYSLGTWRL